MKQLVLNIYNEEIMDKLLWMLKHFENDGVEIKNQDKIEYTKENWQQIIRSAYIPEGYEKSEKFIEDRIQDWKERGKI